MKEYMNSIASDYFDDNGEPMYTQLAEATSNHFEFEVNSEQDMQCFELALEVLDNYPKLSKHY